MSMDVADALGEIAREAGAELLRRWSGPRDVALKGAVDLVTDADRASEVLILERLAKRFPGAAVLAEEGGATAGSGALRFIVDPLDGTVNYAHGVPHFSVTLAAQDADGIAAGVVYEPIRGELFRAARGQGAWNGAERLRIGSAASLNEALVATGFPYDLRQRGDEVLGRFGRVALQARGMRRFGSAAVDLAWTAAGRFDGYFETGLKPWDCAAGMLLVREAGGLATDFGGRGDALGPDVVAGNAAVHRALVEAIADR